MVLAMSIVGMRYNIAHRHEARNLEALCQDYLRAESQLPDPTASAVLRHITVPSTQAARLTGWLAQQDQSALKNAPFHIERSTVTLSHVQISGTDPIILTGKATVTRWFAPQGRTQVSGSVNFWITPTHQPKIEAFSLNTNPTSTPETPDHFTLNLWNLTPAAPTPHGQ